ncbi:MAG: zinc-binding alcohol dehydrogenase family protein, partial [Chitinophagaceae bacterium]
MNTLVCNEPGNFEYKLAPRPRLSSGHAILKIKKIGICGTDLHAYEGTQPYFSYPRILGHELAGELIELDGREDFETGEIVTFIPYLHCGECIACRRGKTNCCQTLKVSGVHQDGGMVEYLSVPSSLLVHGNDLSSEALALVEPLAIGAHGISKAGIRQDDFVLIIGAGPIGMGAMQLAKIAGARVIAMDVNEKRLSFCKDKLQIPHTINANAGEVLKQLLELTSGDMPTTVIDATGNLNAINSGFNYLAHGGQYILIGLQKGNISFSHPEFHKREATLMSSRNATRKDFEYVINCMNQGLIDPINYITHRVAFADL